MFDKSIKLIEDGIGTAYPCAAVAVGIGHKVLRREFFGHRQIQPKILSITEDTLFDLASVSKVVATAMLTLSFEEKGILPLSAKLSEIFGRTGNFGDCTVHHLLTHTSGLPAGLPLYDMVKSKFDMPYIIFDAKKHCDPGEEVCYSCMGYIVLQCILEFVGGQPFEDLVDEYVFYPLGMEKSCYNPLLHYPGASEIPIAATEKYPHSGEWATGHVHDENAYFLGGISGNAGVFSTLDDMIAFVGMCSEKGIAKNGKRFLSGELFEKAVTNFTPDKKESRGLGFQIKGDQEFPGGNCLSDGSYGHTGFTGTSFYVDKKTGLWGIFLTNAVHYGRENRNEYFKVRKSFYDSIISEFNI